MIMKKLIKSKYGKVVFGAYGIYLIVLMAGSLQIGVQLGTELRTVPEGERVEYIATFMENL